MKQYKSKRDLVKWWFKLDRLIDQQEERELKVIKLLHKKR